MSITKKNQKMWQEQHKKSRVRNEKRLKLFLQNATSSMSDSKWRKLFQELRKISAYFNGSEWKMVDNNDVVKEHNIPTVSDIDQSHLVDGQFYYVTYKYIEWLELLTNSSDEVVNKLLQVAKFDIIKTNKGVRILGYRRDNNS